MKNNISYIRLLFVIFLLAGLLGNIYPDGVNKKNCKHTKTNKEEKKKQSSSDKNSYYASSGASYSFCTGNLQQSENDILKNQFDDLFLFSLSKQNNRTANWCGKYFFSLFRHIIVKNAP
ncbi:MAG: hypothetical protein NZ529_03170 [Cytophagaceae bacterium]|nr:hypothetical protein [Cytophagaceae bacterium]MDW8455770.1 hypothetical protein [Cytophagaceae bacterium]